MSKLERIEYYKELVKPYLNDKGWFPDTILGDAIWPLEYCYKQWIGDDLWWSFTP